MEEDLTMTSNQVETFEIMINKKIEVSYEESKTFYYSRTNE